MALKALPLSGAVSQKKITRFVPPVEPAEARAIPGKSEEPMAAPAPTAIVLSKVLRLIIKNK